VRDRVSSFVSETIWNRKEPIIMSFCSNFKYLLRYLAQLLLQLALVASSELRIPLPLDKSLLPWSLRVSFSKVGVELSMSSTINGSGGT
jgi:hypothetical protein